MALRRLRAYTRLLPVEPSEHNCFSETVPAARNSPSNGPENTAPPLLEPDFQIPLRAGALGRLTSLLSQRVVLSCREREGLNPSYHRSEQTPRQMALRQHQPIIAGMFHQAPSALHQSLLEARQGPVPDPLRQYQPSPQVPPFVVKPYHSSTRKRQVRHHEPDSRVQLSQMMLYLRHHPSGRLPSGCLVQKTLVLRFLCERPCRYTSYYPLRVLVSAGDEVNPQNLPQKGRPFIMRGTYLFRKELQELHLGRNIVAARRPDDSPPILMLS